MELNDLTHAIIGAAMKVHQALGPGLLESAYEACLEYELKKLGLRVSSVRRPFRSSTMASIWTADSVPTCWWKAR